MTRIDATETLIEAAGVNVHSYVAPGEEHVVFGDGPFYTETVDGEALVDWVARLIEGEPVDDVHCRECRVRWRPSLTEDTRRAGSLGCLSRERADYTGTTQAPRRQPVAAGHSRFEPMGNTCSSR